VHNIDHYRKVHDHNFVDIPIYGFNYYLRVKTCLKYKKKWLICILKFLKPFTKFHTIDMNKRSLNLNKYIINQFCQKW